MLHLHSSAFEVKVEYNKKWVIWFYFFFFLLIVSVKTDLVPWKNKTLIWFEKGQPIAES